MMRKSYFLLLAMACLLCACGADEVEETKSQGTKNENANGDVFFCTTEYASTDIGQAAKRLEIPKLKGGNKNMFVVHTLPTREVNYCIEYDCERLASRWTAYQWYTGFSSNESKWNRSRWNPKKDSNGNVTYWGEQFNGYGGGNGLGGQDTDPFQPDPLIPRDYQTTLEDHSRNGYDRGHMLGSADRLNSKEANGQTFYLSNMHPQLSGFNQGGIWYNLEEKLRKQYDTSSFRDTLYVVKGGTIADGQTLTAAKGASGRKLIVPKYFFMALLCKNSSSSQGGYKAIAFWMEHKANNDTDFAKYAISINQLEEKTGIDFYCNLPDDIEETVEGNLAPAAWGLK